MSTAKFTITYYYKRYDSGDIDKRHNRTATVYANNLSEAIKKVSDFDGEYISVSEDGVKINEIGESKNTNQAG